MTRSIEEARSVLGVAADTSPSAVAQAYRRLARATHPDVSTAPDAAQRFAAVCGAYQVLRNAAERHRRDDDTAPGSSPDSRTPGPGDTVIVGLEAPGSRSVSPMAFLTVPVDDRPVTGWGRPRPPIVAGPTIVRPSRPTSRTARSGGGG